MDVFFCLRGSKPIQKNLGIALRRVFVSASLKCISNLEMTVFLGTTN